ncbi:PREDICTED: uncharacterized protein LOC108777155 [Cyphomyrmex costatus]|uniref:uncharacterized protein LOC108777155 n=1 Tax=Cyphomyrmex costatus TaxID=456900 RepID=UPI0008522AED|nr:PREDICTED: uncharacterized protein LOC108777155 [Cyphomyrmex costatus]
MPGCCIENCKNRSERGFRLFRVPTGDRRKEWLELIGKKTLSETAVVCEVHFDNNQFENNREDGRKLLRPFSKPNLLQKHIAEDKDKEENNSRNPEFSSDVEVIQFCECEINTTTNIINASQYEMYNTKYIESLKLNLKRAKRLCNQLKAKLQKRQANFDKVFNIDQRKCIARSSYRGISWSARTINKALKLYVACGQKGYEEICRQNLPYPSIRTLERIQHLKFKPGMEKIFTILKIKASAN